MVKKIKDDQKECLGFSDEKISLVSQTYELVESHIRRLDSELEKFEGVRAELGAWLQRAGRRAQREGG